MSATWPFGTDADEHDPLTKLRIPVVTSFNSDWKYIAAYIGVDTSRYSWGSRERPTDAEAAMLASYIDEYIHYFLGDRERQRMLKRPLDVEGRVVTRDFIKYGPADWGYRVVTWQYGPLFVPGPPGSESRQTVGPLSLEQAMDRDHDIYPKRWLDWKAAHPEVFPT
ncbi:hypothetical protein QCN29_14925 [Streptomyces sp. HNM0663]|uniref:Uncharacterized protein n=1 Tax=Streptomyces chengmaiensis TaxID=3040919 RepID=A0ABT6HP08_9ACTN|nr:hypothetical protein [Streptomyces chengmaiensis]MDH2390061.1 hypothetical protein [Streptomyces chengmaiensis]